MSSKGFVFGILAILGFCAVLPARGSVRAVEQIWDVRDTGQNGQLTIYNSDVDGTSLGMPCASADLNGDGFDDAVLAPFLAVSGPGDNRVHAGELHVYFGSENGISGVIDQTAQPSNAVNIYGARAGDFLGNEVDAADVTGDGKAEILACAQNADGFATNSDRVGAGALYVIDGRADWTSPIDLATDPPGVTTILGAKAGERCGFWASSGDVNGDGIRDILVSADLAQSSSGQGSARGKLYIIPGSPTLPARIDLGDAQQVSQLKIVTIYGIDDCDHFSSCIASADFDRDGFDDVVCSAGLSRSGAFPGSKAEGTFCSTGQGGGSGPNNDRSEAGEVYIVYGRASWPATIELSSPTPDVAIYYGQNAGDHFGEDVRTGDFDGDGIPELAVGALTASAPSGQPGHPPRSRSGAGFIFWGSDLVRGERVDIRDLNSSTTRMVRIYGENAGDIGADTIALADVDRDGLAEMIFASPTYDPPGRAEAGDLKVIFGSRDRLPSIVDLKNPPVGVPVYRVIAADPGDMFAYSFTVGDFDHDGYTDLMPNGMGGDGNLNCCRDAGELYVLSGKVFSARAGRGAVLAPCLSSVTVSPAANTYYAGTSGLELRLMCSATDDSVLYREGAIVELNGVDVPTTFVSAHELRVSLDDAPEIRNTPGVVDAAVRNPGSDPSESVAALTLVGPLITNVKTKTVDAGVKLTIDGTNFLKGSTVTASDDGGSPIALTKIKRKSKTRLVATVPNGAVPAGSDIMVRVSNPGPALSPPVVVRLP